MTRHRGSSRADVLLLLASAFLRSTATGACGVVLGLALAARGLDGGAIGLVVAAGLWGAAVATLVVLLTASRAPRRPLLLGIGVLAAAGAAVVGHAGTPGLAALAAFLGLVNGMGRDRGAALVLEQAALPGLVQDADRTRTLAWYNVLQDAGHALGALVPAAVARLLGDPAAGASDRAPGVALSAAGALFALAALTAPLLSAAVEGRGRSLSLAGVSPRTRGMLLRISGLFLIDSVAGGFLTTALLSWWFHERFGITAAEVGFLFFAARVLNALSHFGAAWLARRIGLVKTMVFTHLPSSVLLMSVAIAPSFPVAAALFLLREGLVEMDVPTRQSYVMAVVAPEERTVASAVTHLVRMAGWAMAPAVAGALVAGASPVAPLVIGGVMKIAYDLLLWRAFRKVAPPEETA